MKGIASLDALFTSAAFLTVALILLTSFASLYNTAKEGIVKGHLTYLSRVIEDRMGACTVVDGVKVYAPYEVNVFCSAGRICKEEVCVPVRCKGGGTGRTFLVKNCALLPLE